MFMLLLFALLRRIAEPISFLSPFFTPMWKRKRWIFRASASTSLLRSQLIHFYIYLRTAKSMHISIKLITIVEKTEVS